MSNATDLFVFPSRIPFAFFAVETELFGVVYREAAVVSLSPWVRRGGVGGERQQMIDSHLW